jgi:hypothetical protein
MAAFPFSQAKESSEEKCGELGPHSMRLGVRHIENKGVGYNTGYTTLEAFLAPPSDKWTVMPFVDLRGHVFDNGKWAANAGIGLRKMKWSRVQGAYVYYDYRNTKRNNYNQVSFGLETLGNWWDLRLNGYVPLGKTISAPYHFGFDRFSGNNLFLTRKFEYALAGANAEVGVYLFKSDGFNLYTAAGPYYLKGKLGSGVWGGEARLRGEYKNYVGFEVNYSYDHIFKNIAQGQVFFKIPFGPRSRVQKKVPDSCTRSEFLYERMIEPVAKNEIIPVNKKKVESIAINPATGDPYTFWFVNNTSNSAGTFESPFHTLVAAQDISAVGDIIYIFPGDLSTTGMAAGITLKDNQKLWGSAIPHILNTTLGSVEIPSFTPAQLFRNIHPVISLALAPVITNKVGNDVVTLANNNEISGIYIQNLTGNGITGSSMSNLIVTNCIIQGPNFDQTNAYGINLSNVVGAVLIDSNMIFQGIVGINITASDLQSTTYTISNNNASCLAIDEVPGFGNFLVTSYTNCTDLSTIISGNNFNVSNTPINMTFDTTTQGMQPYTVVVDNNQIKGNGAEPLVFGLSVFTLNDFSNVNLSLTNNFINTPNTDGVLIVQNGNSQMDFKIENNVFNTWDSGLSIVLNNSAQLTGSVINNTFLYDNQAGIVISAANSAAIPSLLIADNEIWGVLDTFFTTNANGISITTQNNAIVSVTFSSNFFQAAISGILLTTNNNSIMTASVVDNTLTASGLFGLNFTTNGSSTGNWAVENNTIIASGTGFGLPMAVAPGAAVITANGGSTTNLGFNGNMAAAEFPFPTTMVGTYQFTNTASTFNLTSYHGNTGALTETGTIGP